MGASAKLGAGLDGPAQDIGSAEGRNCTDLLFVTTLLLVAGLKGTGESLMKKYVVAAAVVCVAAPALADEPYAVTPSGLTEAFLDIGVTDASDKVANGCFDLGWTMVSSNSTTVVCEAKMNTLQSALTQAFLGNAYSTPPKQYIRFNLAGVGRSTRVQATGWVETQMAFGQTRSEEMTSSHYHNNVMGLFRSIGGRFPPGTVFPNHAYFGSGFDETGGQGLRIREIAEGSPADRAGLQEGDIITRLARERIKTYNDLLDGLHKASRNDSYEVEIVRAGEKIKIPMQREFALAVSEPDLSHLPDPDQTNAPIVAAQAPLSIADELAKFAKLRDDGIITEEEFAEQKAILLATQ